MIQQIAAVRRALLFVSFISIFMLSLMVTGADTRHK